MKPAPSWIGNRARSTRSTALPATEQGLESLACGRKRCAPLRPVPPIRSPRSARGEILREAEPVTVEFETEISPPRFAEVRDLFNACEAVGLYAPLDRASLPAMYAMDPTGTARLVADMAERIDRCSRCAFLRRTESGRSFCAGSAHELPVDSGAWCAAFHPLSVGS